MLPRKYVRGLDASDVDIPGVYGIPHGRVRGSWRIVCSYADGKRHKARLFAGLESAGQAERRRTWEWHHVVEGQHYAEIDFTGQLRRLYAEELPCVLLAKEEHVAYNRVLHISETDELYRDTGLPAALQQRSEAAVKAVRDHANHPRLRTQVARLRALYRNVYAGDPVLTAIADNVLADALANVR
jgi:hypothetical protein